MGTFELVACLMLQLSASIGSAQQILEQRPLDLQMTAHPRVGWARLEDGTTTTEVFADPEILLHEGKYYLFATSMTSAWNYWHPPSPIGIRCHSSDDLVTWVDQGMALDARIRNLVKWSEEFFWSPQAIAHPDGNVYLVYNACGDGYGALRRKDLTLSSSPYQRICIARADKPGGPYSEYRAPLVTGKDMPGYIDGKAGIIGMIDGYIYRDEATSGAATRWFLYWSAIDDENNRNTLWGGELTEDLSGLKKDPAPRMLLGEDVQEWERAACGDRLIQEAPSLIKQNDKYYLLYSANSFNTLQYGMGLAVSESPLGPFRKRNTNPVFKSDEDLKVPYSTNSILGPGGGSFFQGKEKDKPGFSRIVYHSIVPATTEPLCSNPVGYIRRSRVATVKLE